VIDRNATQPTLRILFVGFKGPAVDRVLAELRARGIEARSVAEPAESMVAARSGAADIVCLPVPFPNADPVGLCAMLKEGPAPPGVLLVDEGGMAASVVGALPEDLQPDGIIEPPLDAARLLVAIGPLMGGSFHPGAAGFRTAGPSLGEVLADLKQRRETGVLEVRAEGVRTDLHIQRGDPVLAEGGTIRETLGRMLLRRGALREEDYVHVIQRMTESLMEHEPLRMGEALVELGLLTPAEVQEALVAQMHEKLVACFQWERVDLEFRPVEALPQRVGAFRCAPTEALVVRGVRSHYDAARLAPLLDPHAARYPVSIGDLTELAERFQLSPAEQRFLRSLNGERTLTQLVRADDLDELHARQLLAALLMARAVELRERATPRPREAAPERVAPPTPARVRTPGPVPSSGARRKAPAPQPAPPAPAPSTAPALPPPRSEATTAVRLEPRRSGLRPGDVLQRLRSTLARGKPTAEAALSQKQAELTAEQHFQRGKELLRRGVPGGAVTEFERALSLRTEELEYQLYAAWASSLATNDGGGRTAARARARQISIQLTRQSKGHAKAHTILGQLLFEEGELDAAEKHFRLAVQADAGEIDAERGLRLLTMRRQR